MQVDMSMINKMMPVTLSIIIDKGKIWRIIIVANKHKMKSKAILPIKNILRRLNNYSLNTIFFISTISDCNVHFFNQFFDSKLYLLCIF